MKCPGQDTQYWEKSAIYEVNCPACDSPVEFFKDDTSRICRNCGKRFINPSMDFGCASYCQFASQCIGDLPDEAKELFQKDLIKDKLSIAVKKQLAGDFTRLKELGRLVETAELLGKQEKSDLLIVLCAAYLQGFTKEEAEVILTSLELDKMIVDEVLGVLLQESGRSDVFNIIFDAKLVVNAKNMIQEDRGKLSDKDLMECKTVSGKSYLTELLEK